MSGIIAAGVTVVVALFFVQFFYALPEAALGAIVIVAVSGMVKVAKIRHLSQVRCSDFALAFSSNGRFLYAISGGSSTISSFLFRAERQPDVPGHAGCASRVAGIGCPSVGLRGFQG